MSTSYANLKHIGLILLNDKSEIEYVEQVLLQEVSTELNDWIGLGFQQWLNHAFSSVVVIDPPDTEENTVQVWQTKSIHSRSNYRFKRLNTKSCNVIQVHQLTDPNNLHIQKTSPNAPYAQPENLENHWNQVMVWMGPGFLHDANNQMAALVSLAECLKGSPNVKNLSKEEREDIQWILQCGRDSAVIFQLLTKLCKLEKDKKNYADLRELLKESAQMMEIALPNSVQIRVQNAPTELPVRVSPREFFQLLLGLMAQVFPNRNVRPTGALHLTSSSHVENMKYPESIAGKWFEKDVISIEIQFSEELSSSFPTPHKLSHTPTPIIQNLLELNGLHLSMPSKNCGFLIGFPKAAIS